MKRTLATFMGFALATAGTFACAADAGLGPIDSEDAATNSITGPTFLISVIPQGGSIGVGINDTIGIGFTHPMPAEMLPYAALHMGDASGPEVDGEWFWSEDSTTLLFAPADALAPKTQYTIHVGAGMTDSDGDPVECDPGLHARGDWATPEGMGNPDSGEHGMGGGGMGDQTDHMGPGWQHPDNGTYGMLFTFTTG